MGTRTCESSFEKDLADTRFMGMTVLYSLRGRICLNGAQSIGTLHQDDPVFSNLRKPTCAS